MPTRASSLQNSTLTGLTREVGSKYDEIKLVVDNIEAIDAIADAIDAGVDFNDIAAVTVNVAQLQAEMPLKVDKVVGSSLMTDAEHTKLAALDVNATENQTDAYLLDRANHTGTQSADTLTDGVVNAAMTLSERSKLAAVEAGANNYVHPSKHPVTILDGGTNYSKVLKTDGAGVVGFGDVSWAEVGGKPVAFVPTTHEHTMDEIVTGTLPAARVVVSEGRQFITAAQAALLLDVEVKSNKGVPNGYAPLDSNGKINPSYLNDLNLLEVFTPNDLNSMLNLNSAQPGDIAYRLDTGNTYMLAALPVNVEANWKQLNAGLSVVSVNGLSGVVNINTANIPEGGSNYYFTNERVDDRVATLLQAGTNVSLSYDDISGTLTISANDTSINWSEIQSKPTTVGGYGITDAYVKSEVYTQAEANAVVNTHAARTDNPHSVTASQLGLASYVRADKYLAVQNVANMVYTGSDLTKIQYNNATNVDYEVLAYTSGDLTSIQHYIGSVLKGTTILTYSSGTLVSAVFTGV